MARDKTIDSMMSRQNEVLKSRWQGIEIFNMQSWDPRLTALLCVATIILAYKRRKGGPLGKLFGPSEIIVENLRAHAKRSGKRWKYTVTH